MSRAFPDYWYGWFQYGDHVIHDGTRLMTSPMDGAEAIDRALELNPRLVPALDHTLWFLPDRARVERA